MHIETSEDVLGQTISQLFVELDRNKGGPGGETSNGYQVRKRRDFAEIPQELATHVAYLTASSSAAPMRRTTMFAIPIATPVRERQKKTK